MIKLCLDNSGLKRPITILESLIQLGSAVVNELVFCARQIWRARLSIFEFPTMFVTKAKLRGVFSSGTNLCSL